MTTVIARRITERITEEIEVYDDPPIRDDVKPRGTLIDLARTLIGGARRKGPRRVIETTAVAVAGGRGR
jgi:hypothetical protein